MLIEERAIVFLNNIYQFIFVMDVDCVFSEIRTKLLGIINWTSGLKLLKMSLFSKTWLATVYGER